MKQRQKKPARVFTHADIVQFFNDRYGKEQETYTLKQVELLPEIQPPAWQLTYTIEWEGGHNHLYTILVLQKQGYDEPYLNGTIPIELPAGLASVEEEDAAIEQRQQERVAAWQAKKQASAQ